MSKIAFFDFDGTITTKDTLLEFIKWYKGTPAFYLGFARHLYSLLAYKAGIISNQAAKEQIFKHFFAGAHVEDFENDCRQFAAEVIPGLVRPKALEEIRSLQNQGFTVIVVSASPEKWIRPWADKNNLALIGTVLCEESGRLTGGIEGRNCHGEEKVNRIKNKFDLKNYTEIYAYGDTSGDKPMLALATKPSYRPFR